MRRERGREQSPNEGPNEGPYEGPYEGPNEAGTKGQTRREGVNEAGTRVRTRREQESVRGHELGPVRGRVRGREQGVNESVNEVGTVGYSENEVRYGDEGGYERRKRGGEALSLHPPSLRTGRTPSPAFTTNPQPPSPCSIFFLSCIYYYYYI